MIQPITAVLTGAILSGILCCGVQAQQVHIHKSLTTNSVQAPIDGSVRPELISDQEAITVFWISIMEPPTAGEPEKNRFSAKTGDLHLSDQGTALLWDAAKNFHVQFVSLHQQAQQLASAANSTRAPFAASPVLQKRAAVGASVDKLAMDFYNSLRASLAAPEAARLKAHIGLMKKQIKVVPPPPM